MEQLVIEQTENETHTAAADSGQGEGIREFSFKKFKDVESLQKAYSSLESEFTKRSQRLKLLEGERDALLKRVEQTENYDSSARGSVQGQADTIGEFIKAYPSAQKYLKRLSEMVVENENQSVEFLTKAYTEILESELKSLKDNGKNEEYLYNQIEGTAIKERIIKEYLCGVKNSASKARLMGSVGHSVVAPPIKPTSLAEASKMAGELIKKFS